MSRKPTIAAVLLLLALFGSAAGVVYATTIALGVPRAQVEARSVREGSPKKGTSRGGRVFFVGGGFSGGK
jgi:hypothetical protein